MVFFGFIFNAATSIVYGDRSVDQVFNMGLLQDRLMGFLLGLASAVVGALLLGIDVAVEKLKK